MGHEPWMRHARCVTHVPRSALFHPDMFFPETGSRGRTNEPLAEQSARPAKRICAKCPVRLQCLSYALEMEEGRWEWHDGKRTWTRKKPEGVWGGHRNTERHRPAIEHLETCETKDCLPPCRPIPDRVSILEDKFLFNLSKLLTTSEREEIAS